MRQSQGSALSRLLSDIGELDEETEQKVDELHKEAETRMEALISSALAPGLRAIGERITDRMQSHVPGGLQRALVIAVLHALADTTAGIHLQDGEVTEPRALMLAIEEPEGERAPESGKRVDQ